MRRTTLTTTLTTTLSLALLLAGCGGGASVLGDGDGGGGGDVAGPVTCGGAELDGAEVDALPSADTLPPEVLDAVDDAAEPVVDTSLDWRVAARSDDEVVLVRELSEAERATAGGASHAVLELGPITGAPNLADGTWFAWSSGSCELRVDADASGEQADLRLAVAPGPGDTELQLLVMERACASGQPADGRVEVDELTVTDDEVRLRVSVRQVDGDADCQGNPWTPYTVDLGEPLGDRTVVDANLVPARPLTVGTGEEEPLESSVEDRDAAVERALSFTVWDDYTLLVETECFCPASVFQVVVRDGAVVARRTLEADGVPAGEAEADANLAPSLTEALDRLRAAYAEDPDTIVDIRVDDTGLLTYLRLDPMPMAMDDEIGFWFDVDVDSPGDPVPPAEG